MTISSTVSPNGTLYVAALAPFGNHWSNAAYGNVSVQPIPGTCAVLYKSTDNGVTWQNPTRTACFNAGGTGGCIASSATASTSQSSGNIYNTTGIDGYSHFVEIMASGSTTQGTPSNAYISDVLVK